jgi:hypothetical protein
MEDEAEGKGIDKRSTKEILLELLDEFERCSGWVRICFIETWCDWLHRGSNKFCTEHQNHISMNHNINILIKILCTINSLQYLASAGSG